MKLSTQRIVDKRPHRTVKAPDLLNGVAAGPVLSDGANPEGAVKPSLHKRIVLTTVGAGAGLVAALAMLGVYWIMAQGWTIPVAFAVLIVLGGLLGWASAPEHTRRWGSHGFPKQ